jgi:hypothetical protein
VPDAVKTAVLDYCRMLTAHRIPVFKSTMLGTFRRLVDGTPKGEKKLGRRRRGQRRRGGRARKFPSRHFPLSSREELTGKFLGSSEAFHAIWKLPAVSPWMCTCTVENS